MGRPADYCGAQIQRLFTGKELPEGIMERNLDLSFEPFPPLVPVNRHSLISSLRPYCVNTPVPETLTIRGTTHPMN